jgi:hypothetical protein
MLNNQASLNDQSFSRLVVDETDGALLVTYSDTVNDPTRLSSDIFAQFSLDDGARCASGFTGKVRPYKIDEVLCRQQDQRQLTLFGCPNPPDWDRKLTQRDDRPTRRRSASTGSRLVTGVGSLAGASYHPASFQVVE